MNLDLVIDHLKTWAPAFGNRIAGAAQFKGLKENTALDVPCAFVLPMADDPQPPSSQNAVRQSLTDSFAVVVAVSNRTDERGQGAAHSVEAIKRHLWKALLGWRPTLEYDGIHYEGGSLQSMDRFQLFYQFEFGAPMEIGPEDGWEQDHLDRLPPLDTVHVRVDEIDPAFDKNLAPVGGPDGRIEHEVRIADFNPP